MSLAKKTLVGSLLIRHIVHPLQASTLKYPGYQIGYITLGKQEGREEREKWEGVIKGKK